MPSSNSHRSIRLLIAQENRHHREELCLVLEGVGYVVQALADDAQVVSAARRLQPDLVILDVFLPGGSGIDMAGLIQEERIAPVVLVTSQLDRSFIRRAAGVGVYSYLSKPVQETSLVPAIEIALSQWDEVRRREKQLQKMQTRDEAREVVDRAKRVLMAVCGHTEASAYRFIQTRSMNLRRPKQEIAETILASYQFSLPDEVEQRREINEREAAA